MQTKTPSGDIVPTAPVSRTRRWRLHLTVLGVLVLLAMGVLIAFAFPQKVAEVSFWWQIRQLRHDIVEGRLSADALCQDLLQRENGRYFALRLSEDPDPLVRAAVIDRLAAKATPAQKREPPPEGQIVAISDPYVGLEAGAEDAFRRLLADPDLSVRRKALLAVCRIRVASSFEEELLHTLESADLEDRLIVCGHLAHWNGPAVRRIFADAQQPKEIRLAALRSADRYGWREIIMTDREDFVRSMSSVQADADPELRQAADEALRHSPIAGPK
jgi:hypothetical protein